MRRTGGQYFAADRRPTGKTASSREYGCSHSPASIDAAVCGALTSGLSSAGHSPGGDAIDLGLDRDHGRDEAVDLGEVLASVGSTISVPGDRERHGRRVEAVVDQPLGDVVDRDAGRPR